MKEGSAKQTLTAGIATKTLEPSLVATTKMISLGLTGLSDPDRHCSLSFNINAVTLPTLQPYPFRAPTGTSRCFVPSLCISSLVIPLRVQREGGSPNGIVDN